MRREIIQQRIQSILSLDDFVSLLKDIANSASMPVNPILSACGLIYISENTEKYYRIFSIAKKNGEIRQIHAPRRELLYVLKVINEMLQIVYVPYKTSTAFYRGSSVLDNAMAHVGSKYVLNLDIKDFFYSFDVNQLLNLYYAPPFKFNRTAKSLVEILSKICTVSSVPGTDKTSVLPQGSPVSPMLTNFLCYHMDKMLNGVAKRFKLNYSRYADDITFSAEYDFRSNAKIEKEILRIIEGVFNFRINDKKTRYQNSRNRQIVTGVVTNIKPNVRRTYVKEIRMYIYMWEQYGYEKAEKILHEKYPKHNVRMLPKLENYLSGKLEYMRMIKGENDSTYIGLSKRLMHLISY
jgi:hypothetical protein